MKIFLNITFQIDYGKLIHIIRQFEEQGFTVEEHSVKFAGRWISSVPSATLENVDFVITMNQMLFFHKSFWKKMKTFMQIGVECFGCERVLYVNNDMGLIDAMEMQNPKLVVLNKELVVGDILRAMDNWREMYDSKPLIAAIVDDPTFISKRGKFHPEFLTAKHLNHGNW